TSFNLTMPSSDKQLNLVAQNGVMFSGKVMDARNQIVKSADVGVIKTWASASTKPADWLWYITSTDSKGQYRLPLPRDTYDIHAMPLSQTTALAPMEIFRRNLIKLNIPQAYLHARVPWMR
ncbi:MAG: carboxypeptidase-like regulatory domain-containing protein, partial [Candidatus Aminicenantes bacterium]|nr:carboxypeptidase-like regulatory domain-containing protein [Candidatus Aminicenantes bacterium]